MALRRDGSIKVDIRQQAESGVTVVDVAGVIDTGTTLILDEHLATVLREQRFRLVVNMSAVTYVSSAGWGLFISLLQKTREHQGDIKLAGMSTEVQNVFTMLAFSNLIAAYKTVEDAVAAFRKA